MTQKFESPAELHADHRHWASEISLWRDDIEAWKKQISTALHELGRIAEAIRDHDKGLSHHLEALEGVESSLEYHEKNLAKSLGGSSDASFDNALHEHHSDEAKKIASQRVAHERLKKYQHIAMAHVATLKSCLESAL